MSEQEYPKGFFYNGNISVKSASAVVEYTKEQVQEYIKCSKDINYFIEKYCKIMTLDNGFTHITLREYQKKYFKFLDDNRLVVAKWGRQQGKTQSSVLYILWRIVFHADQTCIFLANKLEIAREAFSRLTDTYESLPFWLQQGVKKMNESTLELANGSKASASATSKSAIRGKSANIIVWDEAAWTDNDSDFYTSVFPVISSGKKTKFIMISTPNGMNNVFYDTCKNAKDGIGEFKLMEIHWSEVPGRDDEWKRKMIDTLGERKFNIEFECAFESSEGALIPLDVMERLQLRSPIASTQHMKIYEHSQPGHTYVIVVDVARGVGIDSSAFSVFDCSSVPYKQVATYKNADIAPLLYPHAVHEASKRYNDAWILVEINDAGGQVADVLHHDLENESVLWCGSSGRKGQVVGSQINAKPGVRTTKAVKSVGCNQLRTLMENGKLEIYDQDTFTELTSFVARGGSYAAENGAHDDMVMTLVLFAWLTDQQFFAELVNDDIRARIVEDKLRQLEEDMLPVGFFSDGVSESYDIPGVIDYTENPGYKDEFTDWMKG